MLIEHIEMYIHMNPNLSGLYLIIGKIIGAILLFPGTPLTLLAGATLGVVWGSIVSIIGNTLGATAAFFIARYFLKDFVQKKCYEKYPTIAKYEHSFATRGFATVVLLRLIPLFPFNVLNYMLGVTHVKPREYILGTFIGIIPGTIAFVYFGKSITMLSPFHIITSLVAIIGLTYIGKHYEKKSR